MSTPGEPPNNVETKTLAAGATPGRGPMRMPRRQRWVPNGILAKVDEVVVPVKPPVLYQKKATVEVKEESEEETEVVLPDGIPLNTVAGVELPENAVGPALEFLEFSCAFYKPLGMKKGDGEKAVQEIAKGSNVKRGTQCPVVQVHVRLLSVILYETEEPCNVSFGPKSKNSWLDVLRKYLHKKVNPHLKGADGEEIEPKDADADDVMDSKSPPLLVDSVASPSKSTLYPFQESIHKFTSALDLGAEGYDTLAIEEKLLILNILSNDALSTALVRGHIETVMIEYEEMKKKRREKSKAAKKKAKLDIEKHKESKLALMLAAGTNQGPMTEDQQSEYISKLRTEASKASVSEPIDKKESDSKDDQRSDAVRTEPIVWDKGSRALWRLKGGNDRTSIALQDVTNIDGVFKDKWSVYLTPDEKVVDAYLAQKRNGTHRRKPRKRYQLKTAEDSLVAPDGASGEPMDVSIDKEDTKALASDGDMRVSSSSSDDSGSDQESEPEPEPEPEPELEPEPEPME